MAGGRRPRRSRIWETATGKEAFSLRGWGWVARLTFTTDSKRFAVAGAQTITVYDTAAWKEVATLKGQGAQLSSVSFTPDGKTLASSSTDKSIRLWDVAAKQDRLNLTGHNSAVHTVVFSPDGRVLASCSTDKTVRLWDPRTGVAFVTLNAHEGGTHTVTFSPDGRRLATSGADRTVRLWDLRTSEEVLALRGHTGPVYSVAFSPDARRLASTSSDGTVRVWAIAAPPAALALSGAELDCQWAELIGDNAARSFRAVLTLTAAPKDTVPYLRDRLQAAALPAEQEKHFAQLLDDLDDGRFTVRRRATAELEEMGRRAEPSLRRLLDEPLTPEMRQRVERLLDRLKSTPASPEQVRAQRGAEVLERLATPEARAVLEKLAKGAESDWLTLEARAALKRLPAR